MPEGSSKDLLTYTVTHTDGTTKEMMHPKLKCLIFLTLAIRRNLCGKEKAKAEFKKRYDYLRANTDMDGIWISSDNADLDTVWKGAVKQSEHNYEYHITHADIDAYWGLWTNSHYSDESFAKWSKGIRKNVVAN